MSYLNRANGYAPTGNVNSEPDLVQRPRFTNKVEVSLIDWMGRDGDIVNAARVSTKGAASLGMNEGARGLISYLMRNRHGTPFEHGAMKFLVTAPLFVWREHHRHRIGFSYNEESGRYKQLDPVFYVPEFARTQEGKPGHYKMTDSPGDLTALMEHELEYIATYAYESYDKMLKAGIAREVARMCLPVNIVSSCYVTCNPRSLMHFLGLRNAGEAQHEIRAVAQQYEAHFARLYPETHKAFIEGGRVAP